MYRLTYPDDGDIKVDGESFMNKNQLKDFISKACTNLELVQEDDILFYRDKNEHRIEIKFRWPITFEALIREINFKYYIEGYKFGRSCLKYQIENTLKYGN